MSGLADGLDSAGHRAAVGENCPTIAVMGVPIDRTYPAANRELRRAIERRGCVISEYPPESEPVGAVGFLQRNRLIAALSGALVVVEAKEKSGTMSTVGHAERYGKPVFAVPGSIFSPASAGTNALLRDGRAKAVCTAADLFGTLGLQAARPAPAPRETPRPLSENERLVLSCLGAKAQGVEELGVKSGLPTAALLGVLMKLRALRAGELPAGQTVYSARRKRKLRRAKLSVTAVAVPRPGCGSQHLLRPLSGSRILLAAAPTTTPCFRRRRRSLLLPQRGSLWQSGARVLLGKMAGFAFSLSTAADEDLYIGEERNGKTRHRGVACQGEDHRQISGQRLRSYGQHGPHPRSARLPAGHRHRA